jgi:hypothetical protein
MIEESKELLSKKDIERMRVNFPLSDGWSKGVCELALNTLEFQVDIIELLNEKQTPKKIKESDEYIPNAKIGYCECGERLISSEHNYCFKCGQKIDW